MRTADLKKDLIKSIFRINDVEFLEEIKRFISIDNEEPNVYTFTPEQQKRIDIALKQVENGELISDEDAEREIQKWLE